MHLGIIHTQHWISAVDLTEKLPNLMQVCCFGQASSNLKVGLFCLVTYIDHFSFHQH